MKAVVTDQKSLDEFAEGFNEGRIMAAGEARTVFRVSYFYNDVKMRERDYFDKAIMGGDVVAFLDSGLGVSVRIAVVAADENDDKNEAVQLELPFEENDVSR